MTDQNNQYPCKDCLIVKICKTACNKIDIGNIAIERLKSTKEYCVYCGHNVKNQYYMQCPNCQSNHKLWIIKK